MTKEIKLGLAVMSEQFRQEKMQLQYRSLQFHWPTASKAVKFQNQAHGWSVFLAVFCNGGSYLGKVYT